MNNKAIVIIAAVILAVVFFGFPDELNLGIFKWEMRDDKSQESMATTSAKAEESISNPPFYSKDMLSIVNLEKRQKIYVKGDTAYIDFTISDEYKIPYNFKVNWINNGTIKHGWYNESNVTEKFESYYSGLGVGDWKAQVILKWSYDNKTYSVDETIDIQIINSR